jgi:ubiquinone/menaquinone biosynthesis C-methylase UbiE
MEGGQEYYFTLDGNVLRVREEARHWIETHFRKITRMLSLQPHDHFVDIGCGEGYLTLLLSKQAGFSLGLDFAASSFEVLQTQPDFDPRRLRLALAFGDALPLSGSSTDKILCNHVLEHVLDDDAVMREICRVLRPGGLALIGLPQSFSPQTRFMIALRRLLMPKARQLQLERVSPGKLVPELIGKQSHIRFYSLGAVRSLLERNDFQVLRAEGIGLSLRGEYHRLFRRNYLLFRLTTALGYFFPAIGDGIMILGKKRGAV